jgi:hypothetical protein
MSIRALPFSEWKKRITLPFDHPDFIDGFSPTEVADRLHVSRQSVHKAIRAGLLDAIYVVEGITKEKTLDEPPDLRVRAIVIPQQSYNAYRHMREFRRKGHSG